ncbi:hypothetical protein SELMODRAFT_414480 [Selaginella moellendorffii]|uniref:AB hydrolase-1 domain-containing protein n=1 Tax=Selaginella moellendorffii TaxID=88036 RepID=D8RSX2_SELML|nr:hypothetical protein SELMODRAFT_414480 [Selaginella moellendorffii]
MIERLILAKEISGIVGDDKNLGSGTRASAIGDETWRLQDSPCNLAFSMKTETTREDSRARLFFSGGLWKKAPTVKILFTVTEVLATFFRTRAIVSRPMVEIHLQVSNTSGSSKVVLVGSSLAGLSLTLVLEMYPEKIAAAVYLSALMLPSGPIAATLFKQFRYFKLLETT